MFALAAVATAAGTVFEAMAVKGQAESEEAINEYNAAAARQKAGATRTAAAEEKAVLRERMRDALARNESLVASSGFQMAGTPLQNQMNVINDYAHDIGTLGYQRETEAKQLMNQARLFEYQAESARKAGKLGLGATLVGGVGRMAQIGIMKKALEK